MRRELYWGDNLDVLRTYVADESVDVIYLDPPFNSSRNYNVLFRDDDRHESDAQIGAFIDPGTGRTRSMDLCESRQRR
jgi:site-specific DNA-methyltransferase (adenine-specific)